MLPENYINHLTTCLKKSEYVMVIIMVHLLRIYRKVRLEELASKLPIPILFESRRKKMKTFLESPCLTLERIWIPIIIKWIEEEFSYKDMLYIVIDRTQWGLINILMVSLVVNKRSILLYFELIEHQGNSNLESQQAVLDQVSSRLEKYKTVVLGDREFCSVELARWLNEQKKATFA